MKYIYNLYILSLINIFIAGCTATSARINENPDKNDKFISPTSTQPVIGEKSKAGKNNNPQFSLDSEVKNDKVKELVTQQQNIKDAETKTDEKKQSSSFSNYLRVKTVYELAMESNPALFLPHDEFETVSEYKIRVSEQVKLMKDIVSITTQKTDIKRAQRKEVALEKEFKRRSVIETAMTESASTVEFKPTDIGRYDPENETFPLVLFDVQYQISVPREEARTFKTNFESIKIRGVQQLKPKYDVKINVLRAHIRSRPNGSIIGVASEMDQFEHIVDVDEWYKINYKGQFGFTHINNAELRLVDIDNAFEYHDLVAIHPTTGSMYAMTSIDRLVKAPLNLASRQYESGKPDAPKHSY